MLWMLLLVVVVQMPFPLPSTLGLCASSSLPSSTHLFPPPQPHLNPSIMMAINITSLSPPPTKQIKMRMARIPSVSRLFLFDSHSHFKFCKLSKRHKRIFMPKRKQKNNRWNTKSIRKMLKIQNPFLGLGSLDF